jgi:ubiquinone/menaquinone biosynthesis C-methylase UbiE
MSTHTAARPPVSPPSGPVTANDRGIRRLLDSSLERINFGCGHSPLPGWTNIDNGDGLWYDAPEHPEIIKLDLFDAVAALPDGVANFVYSEHVFEHFTLEQGHQLLEQWFRVLKPGGVVRIVCPDLESEAKLFLGQLKPASEQVIELHRLRWLGNRFRPRPGERLTPAMVLNYGMWLDGHKFVYDQATLRQSMALAGFTTITREQYGHSRHALLCGIDTHDGGETGRAWVPQVALVMEGSKPATTARAGAPPRRPRPVVQVVATTPEAVTIDAGAVERFKAERAAAVKDRQAAAQRIDWLQRRLVESVAEQCAARGLRRIALYGAGRHTAPIVRQPWAYRGVTVVAVLDDAPQAPHLRGVPVVRPQDLTQPIDAVVISSDAHEQALFDRATAFFGPRGTRVLRIYGDGDSWQHDEITLARLTAEYALSDADARWLIVNRAERHDATIPMLPPVRTELHVRRYELAGAHARGKRVLDVACGTGYGAGILVDQGGAAAVMGIDIDPLAVDYATRRYGRTNVLFRAASAASTGLADHAIELVTTFETIEHVPDPAALLNEFARVLAPGGTLILSTPNDRGPTQFHVHSFTPDALRKLLTRCFVPTAWWGQRPGNDPRCAGLPAGIFPLGDAALEPETLIVMAARRD